MNKKWISRFSVIGLVMLLAVQLVVASGPSDEVDSYLVGLHDGASARGLNIAGARVSTEWPALGAAHMYATRAAANRLRANPAVAYVEEDRAVYALGHVGAVDTGEIPWGLSAIHAPDAWTTTTGSGVKVCVIDTGIDYGHPEFDRNGLSVVVNSKNFVADGKPDATDGNGHGTHVAGTIAAQLNSFGVAGAANGVDLYIARVLGDDGSGTTSGVINGLNWCVDEMGAQVANLSLGASRGSKTEERAYDSAYSKGMLIVAASGNDGSNRIAYPAAYSSVVAVGAVDNQNSLAVFSNTGKEQELVAPGVAVLSSVPRGTGQRAETTVAEIGYSTAGLEYSGRGRVTGTVVDCGLATSADSCTGASGSGWIALIDRGEIAFADKVTNVMAQGAGAAIIANNDAAAPDDSGNFTLGAAGSWIPSVSVSLTSGTAIRSNGLGSGTVAVEAWDYDYFQGTSMAAPHAAATAALTWGANSALTNTQVRSILQSSALDLGAAGRDNTFGHGLVQAHAAVAAASSPPPDGGGGGDDGGGNPGNGNGKGGGPKK